MVCPFVPDLSANQKPGSPGVLPSQARFSPAERDRLYAELLPLVRRLIRQYGSTPELRQDLPGEIYWRFHVLLEAFDPQRGIPLKAYLIRQLSTAVYTYARGCRRCQQREVTRDDDEAFCDSRVANPTAHWHHALMIQEIRPRLAAAMAQLPTAQRQVIYYRYSEGCSYKEIAARLSITDMLARQRMRLALKRLRRSLASLISAMD